MEKYITLKPHMPESKDPAALDRLLNEADALGFEVFMDDILPRDERLPAEGPERAALLERLGEMRVRKLHCSYWAWPTAFLTGHHFGELVERFGGQEQVAGYYGDLTGQRMYERFAAEYVLAAELGAKSYNFHLIDYAPIDGLWDFSFSRDDVRQAMVEMIQRLLNQLEQSGVITDSSPYIELENAGFGLEFGIQRADDWAYLFEQVYDPHDRLRIGWDINHLLHAVGAAEGGGARFMLPADEITPEMAALELKYGADAGRFCLEWLRANLLCPDTASRVGTVQLSDCALKDFEFFRRGALQGRYFDELSALADWQSREEYGVEIVLGRYDSHLPLGEGCLEPEGTKQLIAELERHSAGLSLLHELKNSENLSRDVIAQSRSLGL